MKIRKNIFPRRLIDTCCFLLIFVFLPIVFIFEIIVVLPKFHEPGGFLHSFTLLLALFLIFNVNSNMIATMMVDTSVDSNLEPKSPEESSTWRHCDKCNKIAPPRSWHCKVCRTCILNRDHHCLFTGCCIGMKNHRYFIMFVFYLFIGSTYALIYNSIFLFVLNARVYWSWVTLLKLVCPLLMFVGGTSWYNLYLLFYSLNLFAVSYAILIFLFNGSAIIQGGVSYERRIGYPYNAGWKENLKVVLGRRMHLVWLSPFIKSELPNDGATWKNMKNKDN